jgi:hypothetical protein
VQLSAVLSNPIDARAKGVTSGPLLALKPPRNHEFEWTTTSSNNSFVQYGVLYQYVVPTLTADAIGDAAIANGYTLSPTTAGACTSNDVSQCAAVSISSVDAIINPVQFARLKTKGKVNITYGKVEVEARMPLE